MKTGMLVLDNRRRGARNRQDTKSYDVGKILMANMAVSDVESKGYLMMLMASMAMTIDDFTNDNCLPLL